MHWLYGAYIVSIIVILLMEITKKISINEYGRIEKRYYSPVLAFMFACPLTYVAACRYRFWDTADYRLMYEAVGQSFANVFNDVTGHVEKGYLLYTALLNKISHDSQLLIIVSTVFILFAICFFIYKESSDVALSFLIFSSQIWLGTMNGLRQYMVVAALWLVWRKWARSTPCKKNDVLFIIAVLLMASFHRSVLICIPMFFCARGKLYNKKVMACIGVAVAMVLVSPIYNLVFNILLGGTEYADYVDTNATMGLARFIVSCVPVILIWLYYFIYLKDKEPVKNRMTWIMNLSCLNFACNILALKMVYFARIGIYFSIFDLMVIPYCVDNCFTDRSRKILKVLMLIFYVFFFYKQMLANGEYATGFQLFYEVR